MLTRQTLIDHLMHMNKLDPSYSEKAHRWYSAMLPWFELPSWSDLIAGASAALKVKA